MNIGRDKYRTALANYAWCLKHDRWPGYDETDESVQGWTITEPEPWMESEGLFEPRFAGEVQDETEETELEDMRA